MTAPDAHLAPVPDAEADALDRWLESIADGEASSPSANGTADPGMLQAVAAGFHRDIARAERDRLPTVPADQMWGEIMASSVVVGDRTREPRIDPNGSFAGARVDTRSTLTRMLTGSHWAVSAVMVVAVAIGILALYRSFAGDDNGGKIVDYGPATNPVFSAASTPATLAATPTLATPAPATGDGAYLAPFTPQECEADGVPNESIGELGNQIEPTHQDDGFLGPQPTNPDTGFNQIQPVMPAVTVESGLPPRQYEPRDPASDPDALAVADANRAWQACTFWGSSSNVIALQSGRFQAYPVDITLGSELDGLTRELLPGDGSSYVVIAGERGTTLAQANDVTTMGAGYALPSQAILLADGRIAVPVTRVVPPGSDIITPAPIDVRIFVQDPDRENRWVLDEIVRLCATGCAPIAMTEGTPEASPDASPVALRSD